MAYISNIMKDWVLRDILIQIALVALMTKGQWQAIVFSLVIAVYLGHLENNMRCQDPTLNPRIGH